MVLSKRLSPGDFPLNASHDRYLHIYFGIIYVGLWATSLSLGLMSSSNISVTVLGLTVNRPQRRELFLKIQR